MGQAMLADLDRVIAVGNGTSEPEGIFTTIGAGTVNTTNHSSGPATLDDYLNLAFAVGKQYRERKDLEPVVISNDTTYQRSRGIKWGPSVTYPINMPVFGLSAARSYQTLEFPHKINNSIPNTKIAVCCLKLYRMWRRLGLEFRLVTEGEELARKNENLLIARGRYAGLLANTNAAAVTTDAQS
jgi:HK97 family phage major capsid protein